MCASACLHARIFMWLCKCFGDTSYKKCVGGVLPVDVVYRKYLTVQIPPPPPPPPYAIDFVDRCFEFQMLLSILKPVVMIKITPKTSPYHTDQLSFTTNQCLPSICSRIKAVSM